MKNALAILIPTNSIEKIVANNDLVLIKYVIIAKLVFHTFMSKVYKIETLFYFMFTQWTVHTYLLIYKFILQV